MVGGVLVQLVHIGGLTEAGAHAPPHVVMDRKVEADPVMAHREPNHEVRFAAVQMEPSFPVRIALAVPIHHVHVVKAVPGLARLAGVAITALVWGSRAVVRVLKHVIIRQTQIIVTVVAQVMVAILGVIMELDDSP